MAARLGIPASVSMISAQLLRVREGWPQEVWARTGRLQLASAFLGSLITGKWTSMSEAEACATGLWVHGGNQNAASLLGHAPGQGFWDEGVLDIVGGSREEGRRIRGWGKRLGNVERFSFDLGGFFVFRCSLYFLT